MNTRQQRELAARMLGVGKDRIWIDPTATDKVAGAITRKDVRGLVKSGAIKVKAVRGQSRGRARTIAAEKKAGRHKGSGRRSGTANARSPRKRRWIVKIRALRKELTRLLSQGKIEKTHYTRLYRSAGAGALRNKAHLRLQAEKFKE